MTFRGIFFAAIASFVLAALNLSPNPAAAQTFDESQKKAIEAIIHDYLLANPEVILKSVREHSQRQEMSKQDQIKQKLLKFSDILKNNSGSPVTGNPKGNVTVVEFFDYRCPYCKKMVPTIEQLLKDDKDIRYVFKEYPILGPVSEIATRASLAMWSIDPAKYMAFHTAVMTSRGQLDEARIFKIAQQVGYDADEVRGKMKDAAVNNEIATNMRLAGELGLSGTPAFIIGQHVVPGAVDLATLKQLVQAARK